MIGMKRLVGAALGAALLGTRLGREQLGKVMGMVNRRLGGGNADPLADVTAQDLPPEVRQDFAADLPPTPGTVAVAVGAPNAPDLEVVAGDHDAEHNPGN